MKNTIINSAKAGVSLGVCTVACYAVVAVTDIVITKGVAMFKKKRHEKTSNVSHDGEFVNDHNTIDEFTIDEEAH